MTTLKPLEQIRDGRLVATLWPLDDGPDVQCYTTLSKINWTNEGETFSNRFRGDDLIRIAILALQAYQWECRHCDDREHDPYPEWE